MLVRRRASVMIGALRILRQRAHNLNDFLGRHC
jgi:hypothetical protein